MKNKSTIFSNKIIDVRLFILVLSFIFSTNVYAQNTVVVDLDSTHQVIRGFGAANILPWRDTMTTAEINTAFGTEDGQIGFSILRLRVPYEQSEFNINVSNAPAAHALGVTLIASPWSPPPAMKSNNDPVGGYLLSANYDDYAEHLDSFVTYMAANDAPIYSVSVQNEPDWPVTYESCNWSALQMRNFMQDNAPSIGSRVMAPESYQFRREMSDPILNDATACANLDMVAGHIYGGGLSPYPLAVEKGKEIWMTEHYTESGHSGNDWPLALDVGTEIHDVMIAGMSAYVWWYIVRYYGPIADGTYAPKGTVTKRGWIMSQFARFIRPGYLRVQCDDNPQSDVFVSAYRDSISSKVVIVAINTSFWQDKNQTFVFQNGDVGIVIPYVTSETEDCSEGSSIVLTGDSLFNVTLDAESVTTFVGGIIVMVDEVPLALKLHQNYPNPFNRSTRINFEIPEKSFVSIKVHNILGQEIDELAGKEYSAGRHYVTFDASGLSCGIYFYTLRAGDLRETKKMSIMR
jgi:glucuronoarabinoxylan endo-1,4-beta-xylanase